MTAALVVFYGFADALIPLVFVAFCLGRHTRLRGRHVSWPLRQKLGMEAMLQARLYLTVFFLALDFAWIASSAFRFPSQLAWAVWALWVIDDWLFPKDDDDRKRRYEWARVRIRMPKPVKLRPVERVPLPV